MRLLKNRAIDFYLYFVLVLTMTLGSSAIAFANGGPVTTTVNAGRLSLSGPAKVTATPVTLNGKDQTSTYTLPLTMVDARGSGAGWNLTITSTTFTSDSNKKISTLANNASSVGSVTVICNAHSTCTLPNNSIRYPVAVPASTTPPAAVTFFNAAAKSGLGSFTITPTISIFVPNNTDEGTYTSTVSVAFGNGQPIQVAVSLSVQKKGKSPGALYGSSMNYILPLSFNNPGTTSWHLSITSTQFAIEGTSGYTLPTTASSLVGIEVACEAAQNCSNNVATYILLPAGNPAPAPVTFYDAAVNAEVGTFDVTAAIHIVIPVNVYAGMYTSTVTVAYQSGP